MTMSLAARQDAFAAFLLACKDQAPDGLVAPEGAVISERFAVYRNNVFAGLQNAMEARFPVVRRLVGAPFFRAMASEFIVQFPPISRCLFEYGADLPAFIRGFAPADPVPYLSDVARLEWLMSVAYHADDANPAAPQDLHATAQQDVERLHLLFHPSVQLVASQYPVVSIWLTNTHDNVVKRIGADAPAESALLVRQDMDVAMIRLGPGQFEFCSALAAGASVAQAYECGLSAADAFRLDETLFMLLSQGAVTGSFTR